MIRPRSHKAGKAESLFGDILKPFFDSIGQKPPICDGRSDIGFSRMRPSATKRDPSLWAFDLLHCGKTASLIAVCDEPPSGNSMPGAGAVYHIGRELAPPLFAHR
jgi:hypothetical protein